MNAYYEPAYLSAGRLGFVKSLKNAPGDRIMSKACSTLKNRVAQTAFILFSMFLDLRPVLDASD
jgi:hypothetical protein